MINRVPRLIVCSLLAALAVTGALFCMITAFDLYVQPLVVIIAALAASFLFTAGFQYGKLLWTLIPLGVLILLVVLFGGLHTLSVGAQQLLHDILTRFSSAYKNISFSIPPESAEFRPSCYSLLFSLTAVLLSLWMAWGIGYRSCLISVAGTLPFLLLCVIINDTPPSAFPLVMLITVWITMLLSQDRQKDPGLLDATRLLLMFLSVLLVFGCIGIFYPKDDTATQSLPEIVEELLDLLPEQMQDMLSRDSNGGTPQELGADTSDTLDLTTQGIRSRTEDLMMQLSSTETGVLYLRGTAKDIYTGTTWESSGTAPAAENEYAQTSLGIAYGDSGQAALQIKNYRDDASTAFVPYGFLSCTGEAKIINDLRVQVCETDYIIYYWPGVRDLDISLPGTNYNATYDQYVERTCLSLPEDTRRQLLQLAESYGYSADMTTPETIAWVTSFLHTVASYRLDVACQPSNYDFAVYFLTQSRQGYCVHFATAACAMYRALGIPARYASGYRVTVNDSESVTDVTDLDTHAWAEVYLSGYGWIPVETTPGFGETSSLPELTVETQPEPPVEEEPQEPEPEPAQEDQTGEEAESEPVPSQEPESAPSPEPDSTETDNSDEHTLEPDYRAPKTSPVKVILLCLLALAILFAACIAACLLRRQSILKKRREALYSADRKQSVVASWSYMEQLKRWGCEPEKQIYAIALKAKFSQHPVSAAEARAVYTAMTTMYSALTDTLQGRKRFRFRYLEVLELPEPPAAANTVFDNTPGAEGNSSDDSGAQGNNVRTEDTQNN